MNRIHARGDTLYSLALIVGSLFAAPAAAQIGQAGYLKASTIGAGDGFGTAVAISGNTLVVGAPGEDSNATGVNGNQADNSASAAGAAYVFVSVGGSWIQQAYLKASNTGPSDGFGAAVAISGNTIVIGARGEDSNATGVNGNQANNSAATSGAAYVFVRSGTTWSQQAYFKASNTQAGDSFGATVAVSGDTVVVGATLEDSAATGINGAQGSNAASDSGAAYVFVRSGATWSQQAYVKASNTNGGDRFATAVAVSGDTFVAGAPSESSSATGVNGNQASNGAGSAGAAYVFVRSGATWSQQAYLKASNTGTNDQFGGAVAVDADLVVVGATGEDSSTQGLWSDPLNNGALSSGAAYVFARTGSSWNHEVYLKPSNTGAFDAFGQSVSVSGDTILVGAPGEDSNATGINGNQLDNTFVNAGAVYAFARRGPGYSQRAYVKPSNTGFFDAFGASVAISGQAFVAGARREKSANGSQTNNSATDAGASYGFALPPSIGRGALWSHSPKHVFQATFSGASSTLTTEFTAGRRPWTLRLTVGAQTTTGTPPLTLTGIPPGQRDIVVEATAPGGPWGTLEHFGLTATIDYDVSAKDEKNYKSFPGSANCEGSCPAINGKPDCNASITNGAMTASRQYAIEFIHDKPITLREALLYTTRAVSSTGKVKVEVYTSKTVSGKNVPGTLWGGAPDIVPGTDLNWYKTKLTAPLSAGAFQPFFLVITATGTGVNLPILEGDEIDRTQAHWFRQGSSGSWTSGGGALGWALCFLCDETATDCPINDTDGETALGATVTFKLLNAGKFKPQFFLVNFNASYLPNLGFLNAPTCVCLNPTSPFPFGFVSSAGGSIAIPAMVPNAPPLSGTKFYTQWLGAGDSGTGNPGGITLSNVLEHEIGR